MMHCIRCVHGRPVLCFVEVISNLPGWSTSLPWRHNEHHGVSNHQPRDCLLNRLFRHKWKKTSKLCVAGLCAGNSPVTGEFPAQRASNAENDSIWWRPHAKKKFWKGHCKWWYYVLHTIGIIAWYSWIYGNFRHSPLATVLVSLLR